jgi:heme exporter protein C
MKMPSKISNRLVLDVGAITLITLMIISATYLIFVIAPSERVMGEVQRIFYFHVASAFASYAACAVILYGSLRFLLIDNIEESGVAFYTAAGFKVGLLFCTITLGSGMIWGHAAWNTWFRWEPRLVSFLFLWMLLGSGVLLRLFSERLQVVPAVFNYQEAIIGILSVITIPVIWLSVKLLPQSAQLHPQVLENDGLKSPLYWYALTISVIAILILMAYLIFLDIRVSRLNERWKRARVR